jgi:riboflavin biosynthesis pyrimidine reductase
MRQLLPDPAEDLTDDDLLAAYAMPAQHLRVNFVSSADGAVTLEGVSGGLSGPADKRVFQLLRDMADVVLVAAGTFRNEGYG